MITLFLASLMFFASCTSGLTAHLPPKRIGVARRNVDCRLNGCLPIKDNHYPPTTGATHVRLVHQCVTAFYHYALMRKRFRNLLAKFHTYASFLATRPFHSLSTKVLSAASLKEMRPPLAQGQKDCMVSFFAPFTLLWAATCCQAIGLGTHGRWGHPHLHVPKVGMFFAPTLSASVATNAPPILTNEWLSTRICASPVPKVQRMCAPSTIIFSIYMLRLGYKANRILLLLWLYAVCAI